MDIHRICEYCGKEFIAHRKAKRFCTRKCKDLSSRVRNGIKCNPSPEPYKKQCIVCEKEFETFREAVKTCSHECAEIYHQLGKQSYYPPIKKNCVICGNEFETRRPQQVTCGNEECKATHKKVSHSERNARYARMKPKRLVILEMRTCSECGEIFQVDSVKNNKFCSEECRKRFNNRKKDKRIPKEQTIDTDITLRRLFKRDKGVCWICGEQCSLDDWKYTEDGKKYPGDYRAEIDHVVPISRGGMHSWDNVRLAHHKCNRDKSDSIYPYLPLKKEFAYSEKKCSTPSKKTAQYTLDGQFVRVWPSTKQIERELNLNCKRIQNVCRGEGKSAFGYVWKYV